MSIAPVSGVGSGTPPAPAAKPEATEVPGAPDRDHDSDDSGPKALASLATPPVRGSVDVKA